jgi:hypothetical protein
LAARCAAQNLPPAIFYSDLESGPNTGGKNNEGAFVTIWGRGFGNERGSSIVTIGGGAAAGYPQWSDDRITFQLGVNAKSGPVVVRIGNEKLRSNGVPFVVRPGKIYFVSTKGHDFRAGSFAAPWRSITKAKNSLSAGDIAYIEDGVTLTSEENFTAYLSMDRNGGDNSGKQGLPKALIAYPGANVTIGVPRGLAYAIRTPNIKVRTDYWLISQLHVVGGTQAVDLEGTGWRLVGNNFECPDGDGQVGCVQMSGSSDVRFYGNEIHNAGTPPRSSKFYHALYFSTDSNHIDVGWNHIHDNFTCRAIQFHSSPLCSPKCGASDTTGFNQFDLHVHDNLIHGDNCNGINFATVDPSRGAVEAYNNVIYHVGVADPKGSDGGAFSCIYVAGITNHGKPGSGTVEAFNNTLVDCGANSSRNAGGSRGAFGMGGAEGLALRLRNNIVLQLPGEIYLDGNKGQITGEHNSWFGAGNAPSQTGENISADPDFVNAAAFNFHLSAKSPAKDAGVKIQPANPFSVSGAMTDKDGVVRPQGKEFDLGAYELPLQSK